RTNHRSEHSPDVRPRRKPPERSGAILRRNRIADICLKNSSRAPAQSLHNPAEEQEPYGIRKTEKEERDGGRAETDEQGGPASIMIRDATPDRRGNELSHEKGRNDHPDRRRGRMKLQRVKRYKRKHHGAADHIDGCDGDQNHQAFKLISRRLRLSRHQRTIILLVWNMSSRPFSPPLLDSNQTP